MAWFATPAYRPHPSDGRFFGQLRRHDSTEHQGSGPGGVWNVPPQGTRAQGRARLPCPATVLAHGKAPPRRFNRGDTVAAPVDVVTTRRLRYNVDLHYPGAMWQGRQFASYPVLQLMTRHPTHEYTDKSWCMFLWVSPTPNMPHHVLYQTGTLTQNMTQVYPLAIFFPHSTKLRGGVL